MTARCAVHGSAHVTDEGDPRTGPHWVCWDCPEDCTCQLSDVIAVDCPVHAVAEPGAWGAVVRLVAADEQHRTAA